MNAPMVGFCTSPEFVHHLTGPSHPERPDRIRAIALAVRQAGLIDSPNPFPDFSPGFQIQPLGGEKLLELAPDSGGKLKKTSSLFMTVL